MCIYFFERGNFPRLFVDMLPVYVEIPQYTGGHPTICRGPLQLPTQNQGPMSTVNNAFSSRYSAIIQEYHDFTFPYIAHCIFSNNYN